MNAGDSRGTTWCRHRTPFDRKDFPVCKVGVDYHAFLEGGQRFSTVPCLGENAAAIARCPQYSAWTAEEIDAKEREQTERLRRIGTIRTAIVAATDDARGVAGTIACPACKTGTVRYSRARNGHVHARCSTPGCASWME